MNRELPLRLSATGIVGLAVLSGTHWLRENVSNPSPSLALALGLAPSLAAAFAAPLVLASFIPRAPDATSPEASLRTYLHVLAVTTLGLIGWELIQTRSDRLVFDVYDIVATGAGSVLAYLAFSWHTRRFRV